MSTLRSALDELRAEDLRLVGDDELAADLDELERAGRIMEAERARRLAEFERRGSFGGDGHLSVSSWLAKRQRIAHSTAAGHARVARALEAMPATADALASGEVSSSVGVLVGRCPSRAASDPGSAGPVAAGGS